MALGLLGGAGHAAGPKPAAKPAAKSAAKPAARLPVDKATQLITPELIRQHATALTEGALAERRLGTAGAAAAQRHVAEQLAAAGLKPGGDSGFLQPLSLQVARARVSEPLALRVVSTSIPVSIAVPPSQLVLLPASAERTAGLRDAQIVFAGYGITAPSLSWDDYKGADVRGKVVLMLDGDPQSAPDRFGGPAWRRQGRFSSKLAEASRRGAAAVLLLHDDRAAGVPLDVLRSERSVALLDPNVPRDKQQPQIVGLIAEDAARRIAQAGGQEWDVLRRSVETPAFAAVTLPVRLSVQLAVEAQPLESANVVGLVPGSDPQLRREAVVITAHLDGPPPAAASPGTGTAASPGARDSALGVAGLLALAQASARGPAPRRTLVFASLTASGGESLGAGRLLLGLGTLRLKAVAHINLDGLPVDAASPTVIQIGRGKSTLDAELDAAAKLQKRRVEPEPYPELGLFYRSDSVRFAEAGVPSLFLGAADLPRFLRERALRPDDTLQPGWSLAGAAEDTRLLYRTLLRITDGKRAPELLATDEYATATRR